MARSNASKDWGWDRFGSDRLQPEQRSMPTPSKDPTERYAQQVKATAARYQYRREAGTLAKAQAAAAAGDVQTEKKLASAAARMDEINQRNAIQPPELSESELFSLRSNALAEYSPQYSAARVALMKGLAIVPLHPHSDEPMGFEPTRSDAEAFDWWSTEPRLNVGILAGEQSGVLILHLDGSPESRRWLTDQIRGDMKIVDTDEGSYEVGMPRAWEPGRLYYVEPRKPMAIARAGWGKAFSRGLESEYKAERQRLRSQPVTYVLGWPVRPNDAPQPCPPWTVDTAWSFKSRKVADGVSLLASGEPAAWEGSILRDGRTLHVNMSPLQNLDHACPDWLAPILGRRKGG